LRNDRRNIEERVNELLDLVGLNKARDAGWARIPRECCNASDCASIDSRSKAGGPGRADGWGGSGGLARIRDLIMDLKRRGITVLLSSHLLAQAQEICDRIGILADGVLFVKAVTGINCNENQTSL